MPGISRRMGKKVTPREKLGELLAQEEPWTPLQVHAIQGFSGAGWGRGDYFTPAAIADFIHDLVYPLLPPGLLDILEPSAGIGRILQPWVGCGHRISALELSYNYGRALQRLYSDVQVRIGLAQEELQNLTGRFDLVIGNPPFGPEKDLPGNVGRGCLEAYFLEASLKALKPGGILAMLVPDGLLNKDRDRPLRRWLMEAHQLLGVISLPSETFAFSGTGVKTSILVCRNLPPPKDGSVFMGLVTQVGWDTAGRTTKSDLPSMVAAFEVFMDSQTFEVPVEETQPAELPEPLNAMPMLVQMSLLNLLDAAA